MSLNIIWLIYTSCLLEHTQPAQHQQGGQARPKEPGQDNAACGDSYLYNVVLGSLTCKGPRALQGRQLLTSILLVMVPASTNENMPCVELI